MDEENQPFRWQGITAFALPIRAESEQIEFLDWCAAHEITIVRVLTMAKHLFSLPPGNHDYETTVRLASDRGLYVELVQWADTGSYRRDEWLRHGERVRTIAETSPNVALEWANEPWHATQDPDLMTILRSMVAPSCPYAQGSAEDDGSSALAGGDYVTVHFDRAEGDRGWRWVRHTKEGWDLSQRAERFVVNDEPRRDDVGPSKHAALGALCRLINIGDTFHYAGGLQARIPTGAELAAFEARRAGWHAIPADFHGAFKNAGWSDSPVISADWDRVVRVYSAIEGDHGYALALGLSPSDDAKIMWRAPWHISNVWNRPDYPTMKLWEIAR